MKKSKGNLARNRRRVGYTFVIHWLVGMLMFFIIPLISSIWYGFNNVRIEPGEIVTEFVGLEHFKDFLIKDPDFFNQLRDSIGMMFYSLPVIISLSLILAVLLNQQFKGRAFFRMVFFLPVLMTNSVVMRMLNSEFITMPLFSSGEEGIGIINYQEIISSIGVPSMIRPILVFLLSNTIVLVWRCGVQTILFLAGLQSIPSSFYEVSKIEGANKWEEFWLITVPSLRHIISLTLIYTMIELFADLENTVVARAYELMAVGQDYGNSSAILWIYFPIVLIVIGTLYIFYQKFCIKRWE